MMEKNLNYNMKLSLNVQEEKIFMELKKTEGSPLLWLLAFMSPDGF